MRNAFICLLLASLAVMSTGCWTMPTGAIIAPLIIEMKSSVAMGDPTAGTTKVGRARAEGIILVGFGDASISTAMNNGGITKIHHVDSEEMNIFGLYSRREIIVYGE